MAHACVYVVPGCSGVPTFRFSLSFSYLLSFSSGTKRDSLYCGRNGYNAATVNMSYLHNIINVITMFTTIIIELMAQVMRGGRPWKRTKKTVVN